MRRLFFIALWAIAVVTTAMAQTANKRAFYIEFDKKVIYVDSLKLSNSSSVQRIVGILPELLGGHSGTTLLSNYDIQVNGLSLGDAADAALMQLQLADIEKIELSESSASSYLNNGQGGSINIILRKSPYQYSGLTDERSKHHFWGSANIGGLYQPSVLPSLSLNWRNNRMCLHTIALGCARNYSSDETTTSPSSISNTTKSTQIRYQFLSGYMNYMLTDKDIFEFKVSERASRGKDKTSQSLINPGEEAPQYTNTADTARSFECHALVNYKHLFRYLTYQAELQYAYKNTDTHNSEQYLYASQSHLTSNISGTMNVSSRLYERGKNYGTLQIGMDFNHGTIQDEWNQIGFLYMENLNADDKTMFLKPYLKWECRINRFLMKAQGEYQYYKNSLRYVGNDLSQDHIYRHLTGLLVMEQQIGKPHHLRLMLTRKIQRPTSIQLYSDEIYQPSVSRFIQGNKDLRPTLIQEVSLDYISRYRWSANALTIDAGVNYYHVNDLIRMCLFKERHLLQMSSAFKDTNIYTYQNTGNQDIINGDFMVFYRHGSFSVSFAANIYNSNLRQDDTDKRYTYYNLSIMPSFELAGGWSATLYAAYFSKVLTTGSELGDCAFTQLNVGRSFGRWHIHFYQKASYSGKCEDTIYSDEGNKYRKYDAVSSEIGMGVRFLF